MAKHSKETDPTKLPPESEPTENNATVREDVHPDGERVAIQDRHLREGLKDPQASVRAEFQAELARRDALPAESEEAIYRGPFVVLNTIRVTLPNGEGVTILPTRPTPGGGYERRVLHRGDLPDDTMQEMWALGALKPPEPPPPPQPRPRAAVPANLMR